MIHEKCGEGRKRELRKFWRGGGNTFTRVLSERVPLKPESFPQLAGRMSLNEHAGPIKKDTSGQGCGWYFLFNLHSVFVKFIYKQITSLFTVHEHRDSTVFVM